MITVDYNDNKGIMELLVKQSIIPQFIYKYTSLLNLKKNLKSNKLYFSKPSSFNDPFDCNLTIDTTNTDSEISDYVKDLAIKNKLSPSDEKKYLTRLLDPKERFDLTNTAIKLTKESYGVSCFSKKFDNLLMWAHYADKHKGVVIKFDILQDADLFMTPFPVDYKSDYPIFNYFKEKESIGKFLLENKSNDWKYEEEIRVMKQGSGLYEINKCAIVEIIFGCKTPDNDRKRIVRLANSKKWGNVEFVSAEMSLTNFKLDFNKYK